MSFSSDIKEELSRVNINKNNCCKIAELTGFLITNCNIAKEDGEFILRMSTENASAIRRVYNYFKELYDIMPITNVEKERTFKESLYQLKIIDKNDLEKIFKNSLINIDINLRVIIEDRNIIEDRECCMRSFLRGVFMGSGSVTDPHNNYHLEIVLNNIRQCNIC